MSEYPEHDKLQAVREKSQAIGEFLDNFLLSEKGLMICSRFDDPDGPIYVPTHQNIEHLLAEYFDIDLTKIEMEKRSMLQSILKIRSPPL